MRSLRSWTFALCLLCTAAAHAASSAIQVEVSATVVANCQITVSDLAFGAYDPLGANQSRQLEGSAAVRVTCTRSASATIAIDGGQSASDSLRSMTSSSANGSAVVKYELYRDSNRTLAWVGDSPEARFVSRGCHDPQQFTVYARIPAGQEVPSGMYSDVVRATVSF